MWAVRDRSLIEGYTYSEEDDDIIEVNQSGMERGKRIFEKTLLRLTPRWPLALPSGSQSLLFRLGGMALKRPRQVFSASPHTRLMSRDFPLTLPVCRVLSLTTISHAQPSSDARFKIWLTSNILSFLPTNPLFWPKHHSNLIGTETRLVRWFGSYWTLTYQIVLAQM